MVQPSSKLDLFKRTLIDLLDEADFSGKVLAREMVDGLYLRRKIDPDQSIEIERALQAQGIIIKENFLEASLDTTSNQQEIPVFSSAFKLLLNSSRRHPLLSSDDEASCGEAIQRCKAILQKRPEDCTDIEKRLILFAQESRDRLIKSNFLLVAKFASEYSLKGRLEKDDLLQLGLIGLIKAVEGYDPKHGCRFSTYASWWIRQSIQRGLDFDSSTIRLPVHLKEKIFQYKRTKKALGLAKVDSGTSIGAIAQSLGWTDSYTARIAQIATMKIISFGSEVQENTDLTWAEILPCEKPNPEELSIKEDVANKVRVTIGELGDELLIDIVRRRFGIWGPRETLASIGGSYGLTREYIRQLESKALKKLKKRMMEKQLDFSMRI